MIKGIDVSHHNNLDVILPKIQKPGFCFIKATEGKTFVDPKMKHNIQLCQERDIPIGFYHFARPENNPAKDEAKHFIDKVAPYIGNCLLALDWEEEALHYPVEWAKAWLDYVYTQTGVKPLIYCSSWYTTKLRTILTGNYGLWVAQYTKLPAPKTGVYPFWAFWQYATPHYNYTGEPCYCDYDYFNGSESQLRAYMSIY